MAVSLKNHLHNCIITGIEIIPIPPFVRPVISYRVSKTLYWSATFTTRPISLKEHSHGIIDMPSIGLDTQQRLGNSMATHAHLSEGVDVGISGLSVSVITFSPPPLI